MEKIPEFCTAINMTVKSYFFLTGKVAQPHMSLVHQKHSYIFLSLGETKENYEDIFVIVAKGMIMLRYQSLSDKDKTENSLEELS